MAISSALGNALVPVSYGFRNEIINGNFMINQRAYASGTNLASGAYGFDRWKSNFTNTALTFTSAPQGQTVTISASGVVRQIVERANVVAGSYVLSWTGTAVGRVYNDGATAPAYATGPLSVVLDGTANVVVEFTPASGTATLGNVQLELGSRATPFEHRPFGLELSLCQRYYYRMKGWGGDDGLCQGSYYSTTQLWCVIQHPVQMYGAPAFGIASGNYNAYGIGLGNAISTAAQYSGTPQTSTVYFTTTNARTHGVGGWVATSAGFITFDSEL